jgi:hypothetical protein
MTALTTLRYMTADDWMFYIDYAIYLLRYALMMAFAYYMVGRHRHIFAGYEEQPQYEPALSEIYAVPEWRRG